MHKPYETIFNKPCDFRIRYRFFTKEEGGYTNIPMQGIRLDFSYEHSNHEIKGGFMIWPEFENESGSVESDDRMLQQGFAKMWIFKDEFRSYHQKRITKGTKGSLLEGKKVAECEVVEIVGLMTNPTKELKK
jgi:hypothetical protein